MKNFYNLGFIALILVVLGCNCSGLDEFTKSKDSTPLPTLGSTPTPSATAAPAASPSNTGPGLTKENFAQIKNGMSYKQVVEILGSEGEETTSSQVGRFKISSYKWSGSGYSMIYCVFNNDKMTSKSQANLK